MVATLDKCLKKNEMAAYLSLKKRENVVAIHKHIAFQQLKRPLAVNSKDTRGDT